MLSQTTTSACEWRKQALLVGHSFDSQICTKGLQHIAELQLPDVVIYWTKTFGKYESIKHPEYRALV